MIELRDVTDIRYFSELDIPVDDDRHRQSDERHDDSEQSHTAR
jgi:hypothetical protein